MKSVIEFDGAGDSDEMEPERCAVVETHVDGGAPRCLRDRIDGGHQVVQQATRALIDEAGDRDPVVAPEVRDHVGAARLGREDERVNSAAADERIPAEAADQNVPALPGVQQVAIAAADLQPVVPVVPEQPVRSERAGLDGRDERVVSIVGQKNVHG